ncbi:MAG: hypothetical protein ROZ36_04435 [Thermincola sp.]|nr:hypothetical protein [Thermincola sp.]
MSEAKGMTIIMNFEPGMLIAFRWSQTTYGVCKVLQITETRKEPIINVVTYSNTLEQIPENIDVSALKTLVVHMPMLLPAMLMSECTHIGTAPVTPEELRGYENWLAAWQERQAGYFDRPIPDSVDQIMEAMAQVDGGGADQSGYRDRLMRKWQSNR